MSGIEVSEGVDALRALGIRVNIKGAKGARSEAVLKGIIMNPAAKPQTRANALEELKALRAPQQPVEVPQTA